MQITGAPPRYAAPMEFPPVVDGEPVAISATTYVAYRRCPELAGARLRGEYGPDSEAGFQGGLSHRIFARHLRGGPIPPGEFAQACREEIGAAMNPKLAALGLRPSQVGQMIEKVGELYERFKRISAAGLVAAELELEAFPAEGVRLHGGVDAVFEDGDGLRLVDWKTGSIGDDADEQLDFYTLLWTLERGRLPDRVEAMSVATGQRVARAPSPAGVAQTAQRVAGMVAELRSCWAGGAALARRAGTWCRYCPVEECPEGTAARRVLASA